MMDTTEQKNRNLLLSSELRDGECQVAISTHLIYSSIHCIIRYAWPLHTGTVYCCNVSLIAMGSVLPLWAEGSPSPLHSQMNNSGMFKVSMVTDVLGLFICLLLLFCEI